MCLNFLYEKKTAAEGRKDVEMLQCAMAASIN